MEIDPLGMTHMAFVTLISLLNESGLALINVTLIQSYEMLRMHYGLWPLVVV